jgi:hypothetical protein
VPPPPPRTLGMLRLRDVMAPSRRFSISFAICAAPGAFSGGGDGVQARTHAPSA